MNRQLIRFIIVFILLVSSGFSYANVISAGRWTHLGEYIDSNPTYPAGLGVENIVAFAVNLDRTFYTYFDNGKVYRGDYDSLEGTQQPVTYYTAPGKHYTDIVAVAFTETDYKSVTWFKDGTYVVGNYYDLDAYTGTAKRFTTGEAGHYGLLSNIVGMGIHNYTGEVYTWYKNGNFSIGNPGNLTAYSSPAPYVIEQGYGDVFGIDFIGTDGSVVAIHHGDEKYRVSYTIGEEEHLDSGQIDISHAVTPHNWKPEGIVAISVWHSNGGGVSGNNEIIVTWFDNGYFSQGTYDDLGLYGIHEYSLEGGFEQDCEGYNLDDIIDIGINKEGYTFTFFNNGIYAEGNFENLCSYDFNEFESLSSTMTYLIGIGVDYGTDVYAWHSDNDGSRRFEMTIGSPDELGSYFGPMQATLPKTKSTGDIIGIGMMYEGRQPVTYYKLY